MLLVVLAGDLALPAQAQTAAGITISESALTVTEQDTTGDSYTVVLDRLPTASVTVGGLGSSDLTANPASLTFTTGNWLRPRR